MSSFLTRHIGLRPDDVASMLATLGVETVDELIDQAVPGRILTRRPLDLPEALDEVDVLRELSGLAGENRTLTSLIGLGYYGTVTPPVIKRNVLESPAWYTAYTPYQAEISQGRLEALLNFQTMVADLTGLEVANASLLDEGTAAAEALAMGPRITRRSGRFLLDADCLPQTIAVVETRAAAVGVETEVVDVASIVADAEALADVVAVLVQYPGSSGRLVDVAAVAAAVHAAGAILVAATDLLASVLLEPVGRLGADIAVGSAQRFGVPMGFGGPHAGFIAVGAEHVRALPGRLVGVSTDPAGRPGYRLALQTREQHIRRQRATSNVCTAQVLLAVVAGMYAVWHGPDGLTAIARRVADAAARLAGALADVSGVEVVHDAFFDTVTVRCDADRVVAAALAAGINLRRVDAETVAVSLDETTTEATLTAVVAAFGGADLAAPGDLSAVPEDLRRTQPPLQHAVFSSYHSEHEMLRYLRRLSDRDLALDRTMIPLGSCTMKLNATTEMIPMTWPEFADLHPFAPLDQARGYLRLTDDLAGYLSELTGYDGVSLQPNAGAQGELAGLLAIRAYHRSRGEDERVVCLIPESAHGTNAASAVMAGMEVVVVATDSAGNVDLADLEAKADAHAERLAAAMVTYPSTHGVFEADIDKLCALVHDRGGQVYVDGANLNALVGLARPGDFGADIGHINLHKTFTIPHGGGGPGVGPVGARSHLLPFLPSHPLVAEAGPATGIGPVSSAPWGSAGILPIPWTYIRLMGPDGLRAATEMAILAANYVAVRLADHYPVLYTGPGGRVAHECIIDLRHITAASGVTVEDVAKRLADYGFHAPTVAFPVAGTLMIEPTESESLAEIDRFCRTMIAIREEIRRIEAGEWPADDNPLVRAPHTAVDVVGDWDRAYPARLAAFPLPEVETDKYWPPVGRIDSAGGDRNLMCTCPPLSEYPG